MDYSKIITEVKKTIEGGYYERFAPIKKEKKSLVEEIEKSMAEGKIPIILEISMADENRLYFSSKKKLLEHLYQIDKQKWIVAINLWVEPKIHAGDIRLLSNNFSKIIIANDYIIDPAQIVGGDALVLDCKLIKEAEVNLNRLIDFAHESDFETILKVKNLEEFEEAKKTETDIIMIENKTGIEQTLAILNRLNTTRPLIIKNGLQNQKDIRTMLIAGIKGIELNYDENFSFESVLKKLEQIKSSIKGVEKEKI
ncbi:MAG: hypothetical protein N3D10_02330 [Candidatus Micrarchaeota archaeon]|nr:hypothetical protein [Candidatus Micrarchaeota archaeon]